MMHYVSNYYAGRISDIEGAGDTVIAIRIPVSDEQDFARMTLARLKLIAQSS